MCRRAEIAGPLGERTHQNLAGASAHIDQAFLMDHGPDQRLGGTLHGKFKTGAPADRIPPVNFDHIVIECNQTCGRED